MQKYTVKKGDSLYSIAKSFNVSVNDIINANNLKTNILQIGQVLNIPSINATDYITYIVKEGDTVYGISQQFGVSAIDISTLNNLNGSVIIVGQVLKIPSTAGVNPDNVFTYTVKKGDSLYSIARTYNTTVDEIMKLSHLTSTALSIGQQLVIPETGTTEPTLPTITTYTVKKGDSLYSIAKNFNTTVDKIKSDNNLKSNTLSIGQVLIIETQTPSTIEECFGEAYEEEPSTSDILYTVKKGDSLYQIAKRFNTSVDSIKRKNNLNTNNLSIGQILKI